MSLRYRCATVVAALALALPAAASSQTGGIALGSTPPAAEVFTLDGRPVQLESALAGGPVLVEFWATWCPLCRALEPQLEALAARHGDRLRIVRVGVKDNQTPEQQRAYADTHGFTGARYFDRDGRAVRAFAVPHTSYVVVLDATGRVAYTGVGKDQDLEAAVARVLAPGR